jgi:tRNA A-37 threonylcarbamoyl transferase component Bud32
LTPLEPGSEVVVAGYRVGGLLRRHSPDDAVYAAIEVESDRPVELRVITAGDDPERHARFMSDSALLVALQHPNLPEVLGAGEAEEGLFLATEELEGRPLSELARDGGLPPMRAVRLLGDVADALDSAHAEDLVHGDVSAGNVIVVERRVENAYLVDFLLGRRTSGGPGAATPAGDVRGLARTLSEAVSGDIPEELERLIARTISTPQGTAGEFIANAARSLVAAPQRAPEPRPVPEPRAPEPAQGVPSWAAAPAPPAPAKGGRLRAALSATMPALVAGLVVLAAAAGGYLLSQQSGDEDSGASAGSASGIELTLPDGWATTAGAGRIPGVPLDEPVVAGPGGDAAALVAGRVRGLLGSVYPADLVRRVDRTPPEPRAVRLANAEGLRFAGLAARGGRITLFVVPTSAGTVAAACAEGSASAACERAVASLDLQDAEASSIQAGERFGRRMEGILAGLERRRGATLRRLSSAATSGEQARAAAAVESAYRSARGSLARAQAPPAAATAQERLEAELGGVQRAYDRLAAAARRRARAAYRSARREAVRAEVRLRATLRGI